MIVTRVITATILTTLLATSGCTIFPNPEPPRVMDFPVPEIPRGTQTDQHMSEITLRVDTPHASQPYNGTRILAKPEPWEFRVYGGVRWRDNAPTMMRDMLLGVIRQRGQYGSVISDTNPATAEQTLVSELTAFHTERTALETVSGAAGHYNAVIEVHAQLLDNHSRDSLCIGSFRASELTTAGDSEVEAAVRALGEAGRKLSIEINDWLEACQAQR